MRNPFYGGFTMGTLLQQRKNLLEAESKKTADDRVWVRTNLADNREEIIYLLSLLTKGVCSTRLLGCPVKILFLIGADGFFLRGTITGFAGSKYVVTPDNGLYAPEGVLCHSREIASTIVEDQLIVTV